MALLLINLYVAGLWFLCGDKHTLQMDGKEINKNWKYWKTRFIISFPHSACCFHSMLVLTIWCLSPDVLELFSNPSTSQFCWRIFPQSLFSCSLNFFLLSSRYPFWNAFVILVFPISVKPVTRQKSQPLHVSLLLHAVCCLYFCRRSRPWWYSARQRDRRLTIPGGFGVRESRLCQCTFHQPSTQFPW